MKNKTCKCLVCDFICYDTSDLKIHMDSFHWAGISPHKGQRVTMHGKLSVPTGICFYCGNKGDITTDHVVPLSKGGSNQNQAKGSQDFWEWRVTFARITGMSRFHGERFQNAYEPAEREKQNKNAF